jgi:hypothetical protein
MKKLTLLLFVIMAFSNSFAKVIPGEHNFSLCMGIGSSSFNSGFTSGSCESFCVKWESAFFPRLFTKNAFFDVGIEALGFEAKSKQRDNKLSFANISVPLNIGYRFPVNNIINVFCKAGYIGTFCFNYDWETPLNTCDDDYDVYISGGGLDYADLYSQYYGSLSATIGVDIIKHIQVGVSYRYGLQGLNENDNNLNSDMKTRVIIMTVGYVF